MGIADRLDQIILAVDERGFASVKELSQQLSVSEMTIRRDLEKLAENHRVLRVYGGAARLRYMPESNNGPTPESLIEQPHTSFVNVKGQNGVGSTTPLELCQSDVLVVTSFDPKYELLVHESSGKRRIPIIAEALPHVNAETCVSVDDYRAGVSLGRWVGEYTLEHWQGTANILDLTYHLENTKARSRGFMVGVREVLPAVKDALSLNPQADYDLTYQLTRDALSMDRSINVIFAINDTNAWGAINACKDLGIDPDRLIVVTFGLEGNTLKDAMQNDLYCRAGLAMFPEIVGRTCVEAAFEVYNHRVLPERIYTPHAVLTKETLEQFYARHDDDWKIRWEAVEKHLHLPMDINAYRSRQDHELPDCLGIITPFPEHEWYQNLTASMRKYADYFEVSLELVDAEQSLKHELESRRREIARLAAEDISSGEVVFIDGGGIAQHLADFLKTKGDITVITNSVPVFTALKDNPEITLISTGGVLRRTTFVLVGPTAENSLRDLRVDKLFLSASGVSFNFGLSHTTLSEVTIKQAMIRSAREVILLADHTQFNQESFIQLAPLSAIHTLITDDGLPASIRLRLNQIGIQVIIPKP